MRVAERARAPAYLPAACRWQTLFRNQSRGVKRTPDRLKNLDRVYPPINVINVDVHRLNKKNLFAFGNIVVHFVPPLSNFSGFQQEIPRVSICLRIGNLARISYHGIETREGETLDRLRLSNDVITRICVNYWNCLQIPLTDSAVPFQYVYCLMKETVTLWRNISAVFRILEILGLTSVQMFPRVECNSRFKLEVKLEI